MELTNLDAEMVQHELFLQGKAEYLTIQDIEAALDWAAIASVPVNVASTPFGQVFELLKITKAHREFMTIVKRMEEQEAQDAMAVAA